MFSLVQTEVFGTTNALISWLIDWECCFLYVIAQNYKMPDIETVVHVQFGTKTMAVYFSPE